jgi:hypothetical protein
MEVPTVLYQYYKNRVRTGSYGAYVSDRYDDQYISNLASDLQAFGDRNNLSKREVVNHAIAFTQGMKYTKDVEVGYDEYPRYPVETLVDRGGDCEDTSILLAEFLEKLGYGAVLLLIPDASHAAVGVLGEDSVDGTYYEYQGDRYYYIETTGSGWEVGQVPDFVKNSDGQADIREINSNPSLVFSYRISIDGPSEVSAEMTVGNKGDAKASGAEIQIDFEDRNENPVSQTRRSVPTLPPDEETQFNFLLNTPPDDKDLRARVGILLNGNLHDMTVSEYRTVE